MSPSDKSACLLQDVPLDSLNLMQRMKEEYFLDDCRQDTLGLVRLLERMRAMDRADGQG